MPAATKAYIADSQGTVVVNTKDGSAKRFKIADAYLKQMTEALEEDKENFRTIAKQIKASAAPGVKRILFSDGVDGGVMASLPDPEKAGTYTNLAAKEAATRLTKAGGLETVGIPEEELVAKSEVVTLTGDWAVWFKSQLEAFRKQAKENKAAVERGEPVQPFTVSEEGIEWKTAIKLQQKALALLEKQANQDDEAGKTARLLLEMGIRKMTIESK